MTAATSEVAASRRKAIHSQPMAMMTPTSGGPKGGHSLSSHEQAVAAPLVAFAHHRGTQDEPGRGREHHGETDAECEELDLPQRPAHRDERGEQCGQERAEHGDAAWIPPGQESAHDRTGGNVPHA
jgi:hypothetical protein